MHKRTSAATIELRTLSDRLYRSSPSALYRAAVELLDGKFIVIRRQSGGKVGERLVETDVERV